MRKRAGQRLCDLGGCWQPWPCAVHGTLHAVGAMMVGHAVSVPRILTSSDYETCRQCGFTTHAPTCPTLVPSLRCEHGTLVLPGSGCVKCLQQQQQGASANVRPMFKALAVNEQMWVTPDSWKRHEPSCPNDGAVMVRLQSNAGAKCPECGSLCTYRDWLAAKQFIRDQRALMGQTADPNSTVQAWNGPPASQQMQGGSDSIRGGQKVPTGEATQ